MGRPSDYCEEIANQVCEWLAGGKSLAAIAGEADMPDPATVYRWIAVNASFRERYERARAVQTEGYTDEMIDIADAAAGGTADEIQAARLKIDTRKWIAAKLLPKKYGDKLDVEHGGTVGHTHMTLAQFAERLAEAKRLSGRVVEIEGKSEPQG